MVSHLLICQMPEHRWINYSLLTLSTLGPCLMLALAIRKKMSKRDRFVTEDDLDTFDGFLRYHGIDPSMTSPGELQKWRELFDEARRRIAVSPKVGRMKFNLDPKECRYAVAVRDGSKLWLVLWVKRSPKGFFLMMPRGEIFAVMQRSSGRKPKKRDWNPHTSYHLDGSLHMKSYDEKVFPPKRCQPLTGNFKGMVSLGTFGGYGPKGVGAICDPADFSGIVEVPPGVLGPRHGTISVDLVEPGCEPTNLGPSFEVVRRQDFRDFLPWVVITVWAHD
jgi:hypothetical protein